MSAYHIHRKLRYSATRLGWKAARQATEEGTIWEQLSSTGSTR